MNIERRNFLAAIGLTSLGALAAGLAGCRSEAATETFEVSLSDAEWRRRLTPQQYYVLRRQGTERAGTSPLNREHRAGTFLCAGCALPVFSSRDKYESGTGWPSFVRPIRGAVRTRPDDSLFITRTEVHCRRCGGHLGHVFDDGPPPTRQRWCMNGVALRFVPARA